MSGWKYSVKDRVIKLTIRNKPRNSMNEHRRLMEVSEQMLSKQAVNKMDETFLNKKMRLRNVVTVPLTWVDM